ncbi:rab proteins geranylgeranyltransferase component A 1, partial [Hyalella azteca]|uniref:Rab proteins geranylgeranyltransferase component A 1 n=1 Tax=Hyalella azteca TaxID=294128 RepID=A0A8B7P653_HYAAZ
MDDDLAEKYDLIIQGTGLVECLIAGAAARVGKTVLHLDHNCSYGGQWASHNLSGLLEWVDQQHKNVTLTEPGDDVDFMCEEGQTVVLLNRPAAVYFNVRSQWHTRQESEPMDAVDNASPEDHLKDADIPQTTSTSKMSKSEMLRESRRYNIDLAPKILYSRGQMVELLISSNVARYLEFKSITRQLCWRED